jgi:hypothetical protein
MVELHIQSPTRLHNEMFQYKLRNILPLPLTNYIIIIFRNSLLINIAYFCVSARNTSVLS